MRAQSPKYLPPYRTVRLNVIVHYFDWIVCCVVLWEKSFIATAGLKPLKYGVKKPRERYQWKLMSVFVHYSTRKTNLLISIVVEK